MSAKQKEGNGILKCVFIQNWTYRATKHRWAYICLMNLKLL